MNENVKNIGVLLKNTALLCAIVPSGVPGPFFQRWFHLGLKLVPAFPFISEDKIIVVDFPHKIESVRASNRPAVEGVQKKRWTVTYSLVFF